MGAQEKQQTLGRLARRSKRWASSESPGTPSPTGPRAAADAAWVNATPFTSKSNQLLMLEDWFLALDCDEAARSAMASLPYLPTCWVDDAGGQPPAVVGTAPKIDYPCEFMQRNLAPANQSQPIDLKGVSLAYWTC